MSLKWSFLVVAVAAATAAAAQNAPSAKAGGASAVTAFVDVSVLPMDREQVLGHQTVLVSGNRIVEVGPVAQVKVPAGATRIDGTGKFLMPGLGDMHVHFFSPSDDRQLPDWYVEPRFVCYVANGVTRIRVMDPDTTIAEVRRVVGQRGLLSPRLYAVGGWGQGRGQTFEQQLAALRTAGYDFLLITANTAVSNSLAATAAQAGLRLAGDVPGKTGLNGALGAPYSSIEQLHGYLERLFPVTPGSRLSMLELDSLVRATASTPNINEAQIAELAAATKQAGVWNVPIQSEAERMVELWSGKTAATSSVTLRVRRQLIKALHNAGAGLLLGTDAPAWGGDYGTAVHEELEALVAAGLTPHQALETGTGNIGKFLGDSAGTVAAGQRADLVLLRANPLEDVRNTKQIAGVMVNGQWLSREKLDARLKADACIGK